MRFFTPLMTAFALLFLVQCEPMSSTPVDPSTLQPASTQLAKAAHICMNEMRSPGTMDAALRNAGYSARETRRITYFESNSLQPSRSDRKQRPGSIYISIEKSRELPIPFCEFGYGSYTTFESVSAFTGMIENLKKQGYRLHPESTKNTPVLLRSGFAFVFSGTWTAGTSRIRITNATGSY